MNSRTLVKQGSTMWQGVMKAWSTLQSGLEQQDPLSWSEIMRQPLFENKMLTHTTGLQWGTEPKTTMSWWPSRNLRSMQDIIRADGSGWKIFEEQGSLRRTKVTPTLYARVRNNIPWDAAPTLALTTGQWVATKTAEGNIDQVLHITNTEPLQAALYGKDMLERLYCITQHHIPTDNQFQEVRTILCGGPRRTMLSFNPREVETDKR